MDRSWDGMGRYNNWRNGNRESLIGLDTYLTGWANSTAQRSTQGARGKKKECCGHMLYHDADLRSAIFAFGEEEDLAVCCGMVSQLSGLDVSTVLGYSRRFLKLMGNEKEEIKTRLKITIKYLPVSVI